MSASIAPARPLAGLKQAIRKCRAHRQRCRTYAAAPVVLQNSDPAHDLSQSRFNAPSPGFRPSQATKQNRFDHGLRKIKVIPAPRSTVKACPDPIAAIFRDQLQTLDPKGARTRLFSENNTERVQPGDIVMVRFKSGDPYSGVVLNIRKRNSPVDTAILLRNQLTRVGVEMWVKIYSPNVQGIEVVQRKMKRARRAKLYYMRNPKHDVGSVENIVKQYMQRRIGGPIASRNAKGRDVNAHRKNK